MSVTIQGQSVDVGDDLLVNTESSPDARQVSVVAISPSNVYIQIQCMTNVQRWFTVAAFPLQILEKL